MDLHLQNEHIPSDSLLDTYIDILLAGFSEVTYPVHLSEEGASALIPFCAYKSDLTIVDPVKKIQGISYPVCSSFHQTMLEGQHCFDLKLNRMSGQGKYNELMLILDYNEDRSIQPKHQTEEYSINSTKLRLDTLKSLEDSEAKVQINTLSTFTGFGGGSYRMTDVKKMTTTSDFLQMPMEKRHCNIEEYEHCKTRNLLKECTSLADGRNCNFKFQDCIAKNAENMKKIKGATAVGFTFRTRVCVASAWRTAAGSS